MMIESCAISIQTANTIFVVYFARSFSVNADDHEYTANSTASRGNECVRHESRMDKHRHKGNNRIGYCSNIEWNNK